MALLIIGIVVFLGIHLVPTLPQVRDGLIRRFGENGYKIFFSLLSTAGFVLLVWGFHRAPVVQIWSPPDWTRYMAMALTLPAFILIVASYVPGQIKAKLRHPFRRHQVLGAWPSRRQWRSRLHHPLHLVPRLCRL